MARLLENESPRPQNRRKKSGGKRDIGAVEKANVKGPGKKSLLLFLLLFLLGAGLFIFDRWGNLIFKKNDVATTNNQTETKTCVDKETVTMGYKLFYNDTYKYCIQYPKDWPGDSKEPKQITFGTVNPEPTPGWFRVTYFSGQTQAARVTEIKANYVEPAGPCAESTVMVSGQAATKLDCIGAFDGEDHVHYLVSDASNLIELSYIMGTDTTKTLYEAEYRVMVESFLTDMFADQ